MNKSSSGMAGVFLTILVLLFALSAVVAGEEKVADQAKDKGDRQAAAEAPKDQPDVKSDDTKPKGAIEDKSEEGAEKPKEKPAGKPKQPAVKPQAKPSDKPKEGGEKPKEKPEAKPADKPKEKPSEKAADPWRQSALGQTKLGETWLGPVLNIEDLSGQVVLVEYWTCNDELSQKSLSWLLQLNDNYGRSGLIVIAAHTNPRPKVQAMSMAVSRRTNFTVLSNISYPDANFRKAPHVYLFNHKGEVAYDGPPSPNLGNAITKALNERPDPLLGDMKYKKIVPTTLKAKAGRLGDAWKMCDEKKDAEGDEGQEAAYLLANLDRYAERLFQKAESSKANAPDLTKDALTVLKLRFAGSPHGDNAAAKLKELEKDGAFQKELKAEKAYQKIARDLVTIPPYPRDRKQRDTWLRNNGDAMRRITAQIGEVKTLGKTKGLAKIEEIYDQIIPPIE